jgi:regulatory protein
VTDATGDQPAAGFTEMPAQTGRGTRRRGAWDIGAERQEGLGDPAATAREVCLRLLTGAPRTRAQLAAALRRRGVPESVAEKVLGRFAETGLIDDAAFANAWVESRHYSRGLSRRALAAELRQRGVGDDDVRDAVSELDPQQEAATARRLVNSKLAATRGQPPRVRTRRLAGMLARKGYPPGLVFRIVREALEAEGIDVAEAGLDESAETAFETADSWPDGAGPG